MPKIRGIPRQISSIAMNNFISFSFILIISCFL